MTLLRIALLKTQWSKNSHLKSSQRSFHCHQQYSPAPRLQFLKVPLPLSPATLGSHLPNTQTLGGTNHSRYCKSSWNSARSESHISTLHHFSWYHLAIEEMCFNRIARGNVPTWPNITIYSISLSIKPQHLQLPTFVLFYISSHLRVCLHTVSSQYFKAVEGKVLSYAVDTDSKF